MDSNGNYLKTVCTVRLYYNRLSSQLHCKLYGMQLYRFVVPDDEASLLAYADTQWPKNRLWVEGGNTTHGTMVSNMNGGVFEKESRNALTSFNFFYCEYKSKMKQFNGFTNRLQLSSQLALTPNLTAFLEPIERN